MKRVLVIGPGGAGKSTFAARLAERATLPLIHLDALYWRPGWVEPSKAEWAVTVDGLVARDRWIMDGNYGGSLAPRLAACDTVIFLDMPRWLCLWRVIQRRLRHRRRARPDMAADCPERLDWPFLWWILTYPARRRPGILQRLAALRADQRAVVLRSAGEVEGFFQSLSSASQRQNRGEIIDRG